MGCERLLVFYLQKFLKNVIIRNELDKNILRLYPFYTEIMKDIEKRLEAQMRRETGSALGELKVPEVSEKVEKAVGKGTSGAGVSTTQVQNNSFVDFSGIA